MANVKKDKYDVLVKVIEALFDDNQKVKVETTTLDANAARRRTWSITDKSNPQIPTKQGEFKNGMFSPNRKHAESIKIGKISLRRIPLEATPIEGGKYAIDNGYKYIVRMPDGEEAEFSQNDKDFLIIWGMALEKYDMPVIDGQKGKAGEISNDWRLDLTFGFEHPKLGMAAYNAERRIEDNKISKFEKAKENLESLGVKTKDEDLKKILNRIQNKSKTL